MKQKSIFLGLMLSLFAFAGFAQTVITGKVSDKTSGSALPGASVTIKGSVGGTVADANGSFTLKTSSKLPVTIRVSIVGYITQEVAANNGSVNVAMVEDAGTLSEVVVTGNRVEESVTKSPVSVEKLGAKQIQQAAAFDVYSALQTIKGVDLLSQSLTFKSVNMRGFGANNNNRFVQLTDGMDNRSPGFGFGFGSAAGVSDIDIESIEILPGASSALYGPDALQGLMLTKTKSPFEFQGLSAQLKAGVNNVGKDNISAKPYTDVALRYAKPIGDKMAFKVNFQAINGTDFIADDYSDRMTRGRAGFFAVDQASKTVKIAYTPNDNPATNFLYDGVNIYGDDVTNAGLASGFTNPLLAGKSVTRTGYNEIDLTGDNGKVYSYRANAALHYKVTDKIEAIAAWYYGTGNLIRTAGFREYFPEYKRNQIKLELRGDNFFVRGYRTSQAAEGFSLGSLGQRILQLWKPTNTWRDDFNKAYTGDLTAARNAADAGKPMPGTAAFQTLFDKLTMTNGNVATGLGVNGVRLLDNSSMSHAEGMYNFKKFLPENLEVITGASFRSYDLESQGTIFPKAKTGDEFTIKEYGWYLQGSPNLKISDKMAFKPTVAVRYDKNEYFKGGFTPRVSGVLSIGEHNFRASWQSAFRNPSPNQLLADGGVTSEVGGSKASLESAGLLTNSGYTEASVLKFRTSNNAADLVKYDANPDNFTTEKIKTWEIGYKALIKNRLFIDAFLYQSSYSDFIAAQNIVQSTTGQQDALKATATSKVYQVNFNNYNEIFVNGWGIGAEYAMPKGLTLGFNYAKQIGTITLKDNFGVVRKDAFGAELVKREMSDPVVSQTGRNFFISPEDRYNVTLSYPKITKNVGFSSTYRWTGEMWVEQGNTQGDVWLPSWNSLDAAFSIKVPAIKSIIKVGGSNILNKYFSQGYGLAQIGGVYYVSINFDELLNR